MVEWLLPVWRIYPVIDPPVGFFNFAAAPRNGPFGIPGPVPKQKAYWSRFGVVQRFAAGFLVFEPHTLRYLIYPYYEGGNVADWCNLADDDSNIDNVIMPFFWRPENGFENDDNVCNAEW